MVSTLVWYRSGSEDAVDGRRSTVAMPHYDICHLVCLAGVGGRCVRICTGDPFHLLEEDRPARHDPLRRCDGGSTDIGSGNGAGNDDSSAYGPVSRSKQ